MNKHLSIPERLERLDVFAATLTDLHLHYAEEARRYAEMLQECVDVRKALLITDENDPAEKALRERETLHHDFTPLIAVEDPPAAEVSHIPGRARRHRPSGQVRQVG